MTKLYLKWIPTINKIGYVVSGYYQLLNDIDEIVIEGDYEKIEKYLLNNGFKCNTTNNLIWEK